MIRYYIDGKRISKKDFKKKIDSKAFTKKWHHYAMVADKFFDGFMIEKWIKFMKPERK
jgi:hypothetical protein